MAESGRLRWRVEVFVAAIAVVSVRTALALLGFRTTMRLVNYRLGTPRGDAQRIGGAVDSAARHLPGHYTCLVRSLAAVLLLRLSGHNPELMVGAVQHTSAERRTFHAWVRIGDAIVVGGEEVGQCIPLGALQ